MAIKPTKSNVKAVAKLLDEGDFADAEEAAEALLEAALEILEQRGKYTVVGQIRYSRQDGGWFDPEDARAAKYCLGLFSTLGDAEKAAYALTYSTQTGEEARSWVLEVDHGSAADVYTKRKSVHRERELTEKKGEAA